MFSAFMMGLTHVVVYFTIGLIALMIGRKFFDWMTSYDLTDETSEKENCFISFEEYFSSSVLQDRPRKHQRKRK